MTDDTPRLSRRKLLGSIGAAGAGAALGGTGASAFLNDTERATGNTVTAGKLDLQIDWTEHYNGEQVEDRGLTNNPGPIFELEDVKPGDWGEATISLHVFDNPAWVFLGGELTENAENGVNEPESHAEGEDDSREEGGDEWSGELADEILVDVWYDGTEDDEDGGNNELEGAEVLIASGTLDEVLDALSDGVLLDDQTDPVPTPVQHDVQTSQDGTVPATFCGRFSPGEQTQQCISCVDCDGEVVALRAVTGLSGFTYEPDSIPAGATHVTLKAANGCYVAEVDSSTTAIEMPDEQPDEAANNEYGEISNATFYRCGADGGNGDGGDECWPNSTTQYLGFAWRLPRTVGNEIQGDSVAFDLEFYAEQCRHNDDPENPFADDSTDGGT